VDGVDAGFDSDAAAFVPSGLSVLEPSAAAPSSFEEEDGDDAFDLVSVE